MPERHLQRAREHQLIDALRAARFPELQVAPQAPFGCDSRTGRDRELEMDIFDPASLALVQQCDIPHVVRSANNGAYSAYGYISARAMRAMTQMIDAGRSSRRTMWTSADVALRVFKAGCGNCEGDCDSDKDCASGYGCFQRDGKTPVPGCKDTGENNWDYCIRYRPSHGMY